MKYTARIQMWIRFPNPIFLNLSGSDPLGLKAHWGMVVSSGVSQTMQAITPPSEWLFGAKTWRVMSEPRRVR